MNLKELFKRKQEPQPREQKRETICVSSRVGERIVDADGRYIKHERLQDNLPPEVATFYIVKDYMRLWDECNRLKVIERKYNDILPQWQKLKCENNELKQKRDALTSEISSWRSSVESHKKEVKRLQGKINFIKNSI